MKKIVISDYQMRQLAAATYEAALRWKQQQTQQKKEPKK